MQINNGNYQYPVANALWYNGTGYIPKITIEQLIVKHTGTYNDHMLRPLTAAAAAPVLTHELAIIAHHGADISEIAPLAGQIITPSFVPEAQAQINNGWGTRRFRWFMVFWVETATGARERHVVNGWTESAEQSYGGLLDPGMLWVVNSTSRMVQSHNGPMQGDFRHLRTSQFCFDPRYTGITTPGGMYRLRPTDALSHISEGEILNQLSAVGGMTAYSDLTQVSHSGFFGDRCNTNPLHYINRVRSAWMGAGGTMGYGHGESIHPSETDLHMAASQRLTEESPSLHPLFVALQRVGALANGRFTLANLAALDPDIHRKIINVPTSPTDMASMHQVGMTEYWAAQTAEAHKATEIVNAVPSYMMDCLLTSASFSFTTGAFGRVVFEWQNAHSLVNQGDLSGALGVFKERFVQEAVPMLTRGMTMGLEAFVTADLLGEWVIDVRLLDQFGGTPRVRFVHAGFADAVVTPLVSHAPISISGLAGVVHQLGQILGSAPDYSRSY